MQQSKRPLSTSEELRRYCCRTDSPMNSPRKYMCIPNNTPEVSPERFGIELGHLSTSVSSVDPPTFVSKEFQNELLQSLFSKFPDTTKMENSSPQWLAVSRNVPSLSVSPVSDFEVPKCVGDSETELTIENLENYNLMYVSNSLEKLDLDPNNSFSDQASFMATCPSDMSDQDLQSDFEDDEGLMRTQSVSLGKSEYNEKMKQSELNVLKYQKRAASLNDLHDAENSFLDFETTL